MSGLFDRVTFAVSGTPGAGTIIVGAAVTDPTNGDQLTPALAGVPSGCLVSYVAVDGHNWGKGRGVVTNTGGTWTLSRDSAETTWNGIAVGNTPISLSSAAFVFFTALASDLPGSLPPGGRLTLQSNTPVMNANLPAQTAIYYTPYISDQVPLYNNGYFGSYTFTQVTLNLDTTNHASGNLYDVFVWNNAGTISIGTGPAWSSPGPTSPARGTGAGTTELQMVKGIWTNKNAITLKNGAGAGVTGVAANTAFYVGTFYATANGQTAMTMYPAAANGGGNPILGLWNAYNRVPVAGVSIDNTSWTYTTNASRMLHNSANNRVSWVDGLAQSKVDGYLHLSATTSGAGFNWWGAVSHNNPTAITDGFCLMSAPTSYGNNPYDQNANNHSFPTLGFNYYQGTEQNNGGGSYSLNVGNNCTIWIQLEM